MNKTLYEINGEYLSAIENGFIVDEETGEIWLDEEAIEKAEGEFKEKADNIACYIKDLEAFGVALDTEKKNIDRKIKQNKAKVESLKNYLSNSMRLREIDKVETARCKLSFRKSTSVNVLDENLIPDNYFTIETVKKLDKKTLLADLKNLKEGDDIKGATLLEKQNLQVK